MHRKWLMLNKASPVLTSPPSSIHYTEPCNLPSHLAEAFLCSIPLPLEDLAQDTTPISASAPPIFSTLLICLYFLFEHLILYAVKGYWVSSMYQSCLIKKAVNWPRDRDHFHSSRCLPQCVVAERSSKSHCWLQSLFPFANCQVSFKQRMKHGFNTLLF